MLEACIVSTVCSKCIQNSCKCAECAHCVLIVGRSTFRQLKCTPCAHSTHFELTYQILCTYHAYFGFSRALSMLNVLCCTDGNPAPMLKMSYLTRWMTYPRFCWNACWLMDSGTFAFSWQQAILQISQSTIQCAARAAIHASSVSARSTVFMKCASSLSQDKEGR